MITDETFRVKMDAALKRQGMKKAERNQRIDAALDNNFLSRDVMIELAEADANYVEQCREDAKRIPLEKEEQKAFVAWFRQNYPDRIIMMIRNDGSRTPAERTEQLLMGLHPGAADLFIPEFKLWIEMKRVRGGKLSEEQEKFKDAIRKIGYKYIMTEGFEDAKDRILKYFS